MLLERLQTYIRVTRESMRILPVTRYARQAMEYGNEDLHIDSSCGPSLLYVLANTIKYIEEDVTQFVSVETTGPDIPRNTQEL